MTTINPLEAVERIISDGGHGMAEILALAESAETDTTNARWFLGDLALLVQKHYGKNRLDDFAKKAQIATATARKYRNMSKFYQNDLRSAFPNLFYSVFEAAKRLKDDAPVFLTEASANGWTVEECKLRVKERLGAPMPPRKLLDFEGCIGGFDVTTGNLNLQVFDGLEFVTIQQLFGRGVRVKVYVTEDAA